MLPRILPLRPRHETPPSEAELARQARLAEASRHIQQIFSRIPHETIFTMGVTIAPLVVLGGTRFTLKKAQQKGLDAPLVNPVLIQDAQVTTLTARKRHPVRAVRSDILIGDPTRALYLGSTDLATSLYVNARGFMGRQLPESSSYPEQVTVVTHPYAETVLLDRWSRADTGGTLPIVAFNPEDSVERPANPLTMEFLFNCLAHRLQLPDTAVSPTDRPSITSA